jgi:hypothetical protein
MDIAILIAALIHRIMDDSGRPERAAIYGCPAARLMAQAARSVTYTLQGSNFFPRELRLSDDSPMISGIVVPSVCVIAFFLRVI